MKNKKRDMRLYTSAIPLAASGPILDKNMVLVVVAILAVVALFEAVYYVVKVGKSGKAVSPIAEEAPALPQEVEAENLVYAEEQTEEVAEATMESQTEATMESKMEITVKYNRSFVAKLVQATDETKSYYSTLKNEILSYGKPRSRISWKQDTFRVGRELAVRMQIKGKTLCLYFPLSPADLAETKYKVKDVSDLATHTDAPCLYRITSARRCTYAKDLIAMVMEKFALAKVASPAVDYVAEYPYQTDEELLAGGLVKCVAPQTASEQAEPVRHSVSVSEVNALMTDEEAQASVETSVRVANRTKRGTVNVSILSKFFEDGETVTLEALKQRVPGFDKKLTYYKVLAGGTLSKALIVDADDFSVEAEKMILLVGGKVYCSQKA